MVWIVIGVATLAAGGMGLLLILRSRNMQVWFLSYLRWLRQPGPGEGRKHLLFCFVDHYEPMWARPDYQTECHRVAQWVERYPALADQHRDADGRVPSHSFFYPEEEYRHEHIAQLCRLCSAGYGEMEVHLHHDNDTSQGVRKKLEGFRDTLHKDHQAMPINDQGEPVYAFIHGNWCLDNARPDGRYCGVNDELIVLKETGCYCDFTLPAAPDASQTSKINSIYYAADDPKQPRSHDTGEDMSVGGTPTGDLLLIQGPLTLNWRDRKWGLIPRIENGDIRGGQEPDPHRTDLWVKANVHVKGRPEWIFVKVHTHGTQEESLDVLLGEPAHRMFSDLESRYNDGDKWSLHYVSAREMYNIAKAAEAGHEGNPDDYRDFLIKPATFGA